MTFLVPQILSPALPSELLSYILQHEAYPTTLIICSPRADFLASLRSDVVGQEPANPEADHHSEHHMPHQQETVQPPAATAPPPTAATTSLLHATRLYQIAIARHIRLVFLPTVSHLRAYLSVFTNPTSTKTATSANTNESPLAPKVPLPPPLPPPPQLPPTQQRRHNPTQKPFSSSSSSSSSPPLLAVYGFLALHRDTSEWSAQGLSASAAALVHASRTSGLRAVVVDPPLPPSPSPSPGGEEEQRGGAVVAAAVRGEEEEEEEQGQRMLAEQMPVLSASVLRAGGASAGAGGGGDFDDSAAAAAAAAWTGRKVTVGRVLGRWFRYQARQWDQGSPEGG